MYCSRTITKLTVSVPVLTFFNDTQPLLLTDHYGLKCCSFCLCVCACWIVIRYAQMGMGAHFACNWHTKIKLLQERESDEWKWIPLDLLFWILDDIPFNMQTNCQTPLPFWNLSPSAVFYSFSHLYVVTHSPTVKLAKMKIKPDQYFILLSTKAFLV